MQVHARHKCVFSKLCFKRCFQEIYESVFELVKNVCKRQKIKINVSKKYLTELRQKIKSRRVEWKIQITTKRKRLFYIGGFFFCLLDEWFLQNQMDCRHGFCRTSAHIDFCYPSLSYPNNREYSPETRLTDDNIGIFI